MTPSKVLVTGGAGFIGSHLVDRLVQEGFRVATLDNLRTGRRENVHPEAAFYDTDLCSSDLEQVFRQEKPDIVFHLAAQTSVIRSLENPEDDARANALGTANLVQRCIEHGVQRVVYSSTGGAMYGEPQHLPCREDHPIAPLAPYGVSKYGGELYLSCFASMADLKYTVLRYGNVYGPRQDPYGEAGVVAIFSKRMLDGAEVIVYGDGAQERDFIYVGDIIEANVLALNEQKNEVYNIGTGEGGSVNTIFEELARLTGYDRAPRHDPPRAGEVYKVYLDVAKARRDLGWAPSVSLKSGLALTVQYFRDRSTGAGESAARE